MSNTSDFFWWKGYKFRSTVDASSTYFKSLVTRLHEVQKVVSSVLSVSQSCSSEISRPYTRNCSYMTTSLVLRNGV